MQHRGGNEACIVWPRTESCLVPLAHRDKLAEAIHGHCRINQPWRCKVHTQHVSPSFKANKQHKEYNYTNTYFFLKLTSYTYLLCALWNCAGRPWTSSSWVPPLAAPLLGVPPKEAISDCGTPADLIPNCSACVHRHRKRSWALPPFLHHRIWLTATKANGSHCLSKAFETGKWEERATRDGHSSAFSEDLGKYKGGWGGILLPKNVLMFYCTAKNALR